MPGNKWIEQITSLQREDGSWGCFHTLSKPTKAQPITTEQALRRLHVLGLGKDDAPVQKALVYMRDCLTGKAQPPDGREKVLNWDAFEAHMLAAWIRIFVPDDLLALPVAEMWAELITYAFQEGAFDPELYKAAYRRRIPALHKGERLIQPYQFYMVNLLKGILDPATERRFVDSVIHHPQGIYYVYDARIADLPTVFVSRRASAYIAALEQIAGYSCAGEKLRFAVNWLKAHQDEDGQWDLGASAKDSIYFPVSDSWRSSQDRKRDCTARIQRLISRLA